MCIATINYSTIYFLIKLIIIEQLMYTDDTIIISTTSLTVIKCIISAVMFYNSVLNA